jgi:hypothetical protein
MTCRKPGYFNKTIRDCDGSLETNWFTFDARSEDSSNTVSICARILEYPPRDKWVSITK